MRFFALFVALAVVVFYDPSTVARRSCVCNAMPIPNPFQNETASGMSPNSCNDLAESYLEAILNYSSVCLSNLTLRDCCDAKLVGSRTGVYWVSASDSGQRREGMCDMQTRGGGWLVITRRINPKNSPNKFVRGWTNYKEGFGKLDLNFWWGLEGMHEMTSAAETELLIVLHHVATHSGPPGTPINPECEDRTNKWLYMHYDRFHVGGPETNYTLTVHNYSGSLTQDTLGENNGSMFTTFDRDNDGRPNHNCAALVERNCGWWYTDGSKDYCSLALPLNSQGIYWTERRGRLDSFTCEYDYFEMKIRPKHFPCLQPFK